MPYPTAQTPRDPPADAPTLAELCGRLAHLAGPTDAAGAFPAEQLRLCGQAGVFRWFLDPAWGGLGWDEEAIVRGYLALAEACLTTTFVITQRTGACRRLAAGGSEPLRAELLPRLARGDLFATVGISHLTTSGRHLAQPLLVAEPDSDGYTLTGRAPWVTGAVAADWLVVGASVVDRGAPTGEELLVALPASLPGIEVLPPESMVALTASATGPVAFHGAHVQQAAVLAGPRPQVMSSGAGARTGGHETSTLALGLARAALKRLEGEASHRPDLRRPAESLRAELDATVDDLLAVARGEPACGTQELRQRANSLALRATQGALTAAKGRGFLASDPVGRWCREALFFLVWSCPQPVATANLCELAGLTD